MTQTIDDLSIEELQNRLLEIQEKIKEKEKDNLIDQLAQALRLKETAFIQELLELARREKAPITKIPRPAPVEKKPSKFVGKSEVYLRGGKVFYGIQEVKYTRLDRNGILRISKDGKGLPPKVESLPAHIQRLVLALPQKKEIAPASNAASPKAGSTKNDDTVLTPAAEAVEKADASDFVQTASDTSITATHADASEVESQGASEQPERSNDELDEVERVLRVEISQEAHDESSDDLAQVDLLEATEEQDSPIEPVRKRKSKARPTPEVLEPMDLQREPGQEPAATAAKPKKPEFHVLQGSFF